MQNVLRKADLHGGAAQRVIDAAIRRAQASKMYGMARPGTRTPQIITFPTPRGYPISQVRPPIEYPKMIISFSAYFVFI